MLVAAHQPNFLPWLGYYDKMIKADVFVIIDHVQFERQGFQNRTQVKTGQGPMWVIVPVKQASRDERVIEKLVDNTGQGYHSWGHRVSATIRCAYQGAPYFKDYVRPFLEVLDARWDKLFDLNFKLLQLSCDALNIKTPLMRSSELHITGQKSDMVLEMCQAVGAQVYLSGAGGSKGYLDNTAFQNAGVQIQWQDFPHPHYHQHPSPKTFVEKMSIIDLLANCGPHSREVLR